MASIKKIARGKDQIAALQTVLDAIGIQDMKHVGYKPGESVLRGDLSETHQGDARIKWRANAMTFAQYASLYQLLSGFDNDVTLQTQYLIGQETQHLNARAHLPQPADLRQTLYGFENVEIEFILEGVATVMSAGTLGGIKLVGEAAGTLGGGTLDINWLTNIYDDFGWSDVSVSNDSITVDEMARYLITLRVPVRTGSSVGYLGLSILKNGSVLEIVGEEIPANTDRMLNLTTIVELDNGDIIKVRCYNGTPSISHFGNLSSSISGFGEDVNSTMEIEKLKTIDQIGFGAESAAP